MGVTSTTGATRRREWMAVMALTVVLAVVFVWFAEIDPGTEAQSYVVDICMPNRTRGLQCQLGRAPFES